MLAVMLLNQHRVLSTKTIRPRALCGPRCMKHAIRTWSAVGSEAPPLQLGKKSKTSFVHGQMESPNTSQLAVDHNLSRFGQAHSNRSVTGPGYESTALECTSHSTHVPSTYSLFTQKRGCPVRQGCLIDYVQLAQPSVYIIVSPVDHLRNQLKDHTGYDQGSEINKPGRVMLLVGEARWTGCLNVWLSGPLEWYTVIQ